MKCGGCGHPLDESTEEARRTAWIAEPVICWACAARERKSRADNEGEKRAAPGTLYRVRDRSYD